MENQLDIARSSVLRYMLRPLVRFCLRHAKPLQEFVEVLKLVYVEIAIEELSRETRKINVSRLSVVTGVHRHDVERIFREKRPPIRKSAGLLARVTNRWETDSRFCNKAGAPRVLTIEGEDSEFRALVASVSKTLNAGTVLYGLLRAGAAEKTAKGLRLMRKPIYVSKDPAGAYEFLGRNLESLMEAAEENLVRNPDPKNLHIRTEFNNIFLAELPSIRAWLLREGRAFHAKARKFLSKFDGDLNLERTARGDAAGGRVVLGAFGLTFGAGEDHSPANPEPK